MECNMTQYELISLYTHMHTRTHRRTLLRMHAPMHTHYCLLQRVYIRMCVCTYIHTVHMCPARYCARNHIKPVLAQTILGVRDLIDYGD